MTAQDMMDWAASTFDTASYSAYFNKQLRVLAASLPASGGARIYALLARLMEMACKAACDCVQQQEGGPFAAMLVDFNTDDGIPSIVGFVTNHFNTRGDPCSHGEINALRDAARHLGYSDFSGLVLISSCECCPMCLAAARACGIGEVYFAATREDARTAGFSDAVQYELMRAGGIEKHAIPIHDISLLDGHDAMVEFTYDGKAYRYYGDYKNANLLDPADTPSVQAIRHACDGLALLRKEITFHLPEDTVLACNGQPHPFSLVAADWARIGRVRGDDPSDPAQDKPQKDISRIRYIPEASAEIMAVYSAEGAFAMPPEAVWEEIRASSAVHVPVGAAALAPFRLWQVQVENHDVPRY